MAALAKPLEQRTAAEKEAVRNRRKREKRKQARLAAALPVPVAAAALPASSAASTAHSQPLARTSARCTRVAIRDDSMPLNSADLEDILGRLLSPHPVAPATAAHAANDVPPSLPLSPARFCLTAQHAFRLAV